MRRAPCCSARAPRFMHSTSNTYLGLSEATRLVSSPMMVPRAASLDSFTQVERPNLMELSLQVSTDEQRDVGIRIEGIPEAAEARVVLGQMAPPPLLKRRELGKLESSAVHRQRRDDARSAAISVRERMDCGHCHVDPRGTDGGMLKPLLDDRAGAVDELGYVLRRWRLKHELARAVVNEMCWPGSEPSG